MQRPGTPGTGIGGADPGAGVAPGAPGGAAAVASGPRVFRRLTLRQFKNAVRDLVGDVPLTSNLEEIRPERDNEGEFTTMAAARVGFDDGDVASLFQVALGAARAAFAGDKTRAALVGCTPVQPADGCVKGFVEGFGRRAFRRPLSATESERYGRLVATAVQLGADVWIGLEHVVATMLQSPNFLYLADLGEPEPKLGGVRRYTAYEMAARLSFAITGSIPDGELLDAAGRGDTLTSDGLRSQVKRLLARPEGKKGLLAGFFAEYLDLDGLEGLSKDPTVYAGNMALLGAAMRGEMEKAVDDSAFAKAEPFARLLLRRDTFVNQDLARLYGVAGVTGSAMKAVTLAEGDPRVGLLGWAGFLALHAGPKLTMPPTRGKFVRERILCQPVLSPPPDVDLTAADLGLPPVRTKRVESEARLKLPACAGCHAFVDPLGLALENFDAVGAYRKADRGLPIDAGGSLDGVAFDGLRGMAALVEQHAAVPSCLAKQFFRYGAGVKPGAGEAAGLDAIGKSTSGVMATLAAEVVASDAFRRFVEERRTP